LAAQQSLEVKGYDSPDLPFYNALSPKKQSEILDQLKVFLRTIEAVVSSGDRLDNHERSLWHALMTLGLVPPSDWFSKLSAGDVLEIYDLQNIQLWRNFNFMKICSYTLEEMYSIDWPNRYIRPSEKNHEILDAIRIVTTDTGTDVYFGEVREHILEETSSSDRLILEARHDWFSRVRNTQGETVGWMVNSTVRILGKGLNKTDLRPKLQVAYSRPPEL